MEDQAERALAGELNRLYWDGGMSVRQVCEALDITTATLYRLLEPLPSGGRCAACEGALGFRNRTARDGGEATCASCGATAAADADAAKGADAAEGANAAKVADAAEGADSAGSGGRADPDWVADAVDDALASTEKVFREVVVVAVGVVAVLALGVVGFITRQRRG
ncbi:MAG TPA: hypothetical protein VML95_11590 [Longimicrobiales bacterium]|nr:hypothetical protein [Longimicrobiales bacterium]